MGRTFSFVGGAFAAGPSASASSAGGREPFVPGLEGLMPQLPAQAADRASAVLERHRASLMFTPGVMGAGVGLSDQADGEAAIVVYVNKDSARPFLPDNIEGIPVRTVFTISSSPANWAPINSTFLGHRSRICGPEFFTT